MRPTRLRLLTYILLFLAVHAEAFARSPRPYGTALMWRILGKKVRARGQFAPLLSGTYFSYPLWAIRNAPKRVPSAEDNPPIVALVDAREQGVGVQQSLASLEAEGVQAFVITDHVRSDIQRAVSAIDWARGP